MMMQEEYTTVSTPESCDGYLGLMIGGALWYPLYSEKNVASTAKQIAELVGDHARTGKEGTYQRPSAEDAGNLKVSPDAYGEKNSASDDRFDVLEKLLSNIDGKLDNVMETLSRQEGKIQTIESTLNACETIDAVKQSYLLTKYSFRNRSTAVVSNE